MRGLIEEGRVVFCQQLLVKAHVLSSKGAGELSSQVLGKP